MNKRIFILFFFIGVAIGIALMYWIATTLAEFLTDFFGFYVGPEKVAAMIILVIVLKIVPSRVMNFDKRDINRQRKRGTK